MGLNGPACLWMGGDGFALGLGLGYLDWKLLVMFLRFVDDWRDGGQVWDDVMCILCVCVSFRVMTFQ